MRIAAIPVPTIARELGIAEQTVYTDTSRALESRVRELDAAVNEYRALELEKLETMERVAWGVVHHARPHVSVSGRVARHPETGEVLLDDGPPLAAIDRLLRIQERRARLMGLDAAAKTTVTVEATSPQDVDAEICRLFSELVAGRPELPPGHPEA
jgi:hypothetical protein